MKRDTSFGVCLSKIIRKVRIVLRVVVTEMGEIEGGLANVALVGKT